MSTLSAFLPPRPIGVKSSRRFYGRRHRSEPSGSRPRARFGATTLLSTSLKPSILTLHVCLGPAAVQSLSPLGSCLGVLLGLHNTGERLISPHLAAGSPPLHLRSCYPALKLLSSTLLHTHFPFYIALTVYAGPSQSDRLVTRCQHISPRRQ